MEVLTTARGQIVTRGEKPEKPRPDFPLFPHANGQWAKKVRGKLHYFGPWAEPDAALDLWLNQKDDLLAARKPREQRDGLTVKLLCNLFLAHKQSLRDAGELTERTWQTYHDDAQRLARIVGKNRLIEDIDGQDLQQLRDELAKTMAPYTLANAITRYRSIFKYAYDESLIERPVRFGQAFKKPSRAAVRKHRAEKKHANGKRMFEATELRQLLEAASQPLKAFILLGVNAGFGATDIARMPRSVIDLQAGWIDYARAKTGIPRRVPLWPETVQALREALEKPRTPKDPAHAHLAFVTKYGHPFVRVADTKKAGSVDGIGQEFNKLLKALGLKRPGLSFYACRHTFETVAGGCKDQVAINAIMGHVDESMAAMYREDIDDARLQAAVTAVRQWLFPKPKRKQKRNRKR